MNNKRNFSVAATLVAIGATAYSCSPNNAEDDASDQGATAGAGAASGAGSASGGQGGAANSTTTMVGNVTIGAGVGGNGQGGDDDCPDVVVEATYEVKPADIIFVIDNSGSMGGEIAQVEQNINTNFAQLIGASMIDYQVIMVADHGSGPYDVCIEAPLSSIPQGGCNNIGNTPPGETAKFKHYDVNIGSHDALCKLLSSFDGTLATENQQHPQGWGALLRPEALKVFVAITDDGIVCNYDGKSYNDSDKVGTSNPPTFGAKVAIDWDGALLNLSPVQFGTTAERNYRFYSILGMAQKDPNMPLEPWHFSDPITASKCPQGSVAPGTGYQWLSKGTEGLRYPICPVNTVQDFSAVFKDIAAGVVSGTKVPCEFDLPDPPPGQSIDYDKIALTFTPSMGPPKVFSQVPDSSACSNDDDKFYIEGSKIILCDEACKLVTSDDSAKVDVNIPCDAITS